MLDLPAPLRRSIAAGGSGLVVVAIRLGAMGDIVRTLPAVRLVRAALPASAIHWIAWEPWSDLLRNHPDLAGTIALPRAALRAAARAPLRWPGLAASLRGIAGSLRALGPGLVLDFHGDLRSGLLGRLSGAPVRLGYAGHQQKEGNRLFTTLRVPSAGRRTPRLERNLDLVRALGLPDAPVPDAGLAIPPEARARAAEIARLAGSGRYAVLGPGASRRQSYKKPPAELFAAAARALASAGIAPLVVHGPGEEDDAARVVRASGGRLPVAPPTSLLELAALLAGARLFVGGDTGPLHLACGVSCPVAGLYGPTDPQVNTPWGVPFVALAPPGRAYTGIKARDRSAGGFAGLTEAAVEAGVRDLADRLRAP